MLELNLSQFFTPDQFKSALAACAGSAGLEDRVSRLRRWMLPLAEDVRSKGILPEYMCHHLECVYRQLTGASK